MNKKLYRIILTGTLWLIILLFLDNIAVELFATGVWAAYAFVFNEES